MHLQTHLASLSLHEEKPKELSLNSLPIDPWSLPPHLKPQRIRLETWGTTEDQEDLKLQPSKGG